MNTNIVDGRALALGLKNKLKEEARTGVPAIMAVISVGSNEVTTRYINRKIAFGADIGVEVRHFDLMETTTQAEILALLQSLNNDESITGVIVQLPLPFQLNTAEILGVIDPKKDADALSIDSLVDSPVVLAIREIFQAFGVEPRGKKAVVIGQGRLVGKPAGVFLAGAGADVKQFDLDKKEGWEDSLRQADIIVTGAGVPGLIKPAMLKPGVVLIDAATSESNGKLAGDADPLCAEVCSVFTPVPGGVGPLTIACLFKNILTLKSRS